MGDDVGLPDSLTDTLKDIRAVPPGTPKLLFLGGSGGTGKTRLLNTIAAKLRLEGKVVLCTAFTGFALHSFLPIDTDIYTNEL